MLGKLNKHLFLVAVVFVVATQISASAFAQNQNSTSSDTSNTAKKQKATEKKSTSANQSVAQGLSIAESMLLNQSPWGIFFNATATRGLDEFADTWSSVNTLSLSYRIDSASALGLNLGYETVLYEKGGAL
ncbi:hypothetical protein K2X05_15025, partial [bacterium]|nr:hypothetical protein [bacterium]